MTKTIQAIRDLRAEAEARGDVSQIELCDLVLETKSVLRDSDTCEALSLTDLDCDAATYVRLICESIDHAGGHVLYTRKHLPNRRVYAA